MKKPTPLTPEEKAIMRQVANGGDVWGYVEAKVLRRVERDFPHYIKIGKAADAPRDGAAQQPYFGAILTADGRSATGLSREFGTRAA